MVIKLNIQQVIIISFQNKYLLIEKPREIFYNKILQNNEKRMIKLQNPYQKGQTVIRIQKALQSLGYQVGNIDGIYGPNTEKAVRLFQKNNGLAADGIVGPNTKERLLGTQNIQTKGKSMTILASGFTDKIGCYKNNNLYEDFYYAELQMGTSLGCLPAYQEARITIKGTTVKAKKGDIGKGGPNNPKIDLHERLCTALGIKDPDNFLDYVQFQLI